MTDDTALALSVAAMTSGIVGWVFSLSAMVVVAFVLIFAAVGVIAMDDRTPSGELAVTAGSIFVAGLGVAALGYFLDSVPVSFGGYSVAVVAFMVGVGEAWAAKR